MKYQVDVTNTSYVFIAAIPTDVEVMENSGFTAEPLGFDAAIEEFVRRMNQLLYRGAILLLTLFPFILLIIVLPSQIAEILFTPGLIVSMILTFAGLYFLARSEIWKIYIYGLRILRRISPPEPIVTERYAIIRLQNTFIFMLQKAPGGLFFVSFFHSDLSPSSEIKVPTVFWKWSSALHIRGLRVHDKTGTFSVPTPEGEVLSGEGVLLVIPIRGSSYVLHTPEFSRDRLLAVADYASLLTSGAESVN